MIEEFAPAKINLALHVTGQRADGYHLLDMLVTFVNVGDRLIFCAAEQDQFTLSGRFGAQLQADAAAGAGNLALKARDTLRALAEAQGLRAPPVHIHLEKNLPIASGIGGGSADGAASLRGLDRFWGLNTGIERLRQIGLPLGADVPMCVESRPLVARGIGEDIRLLRGFPRLFMLLANPMVAVSTPAIFKQLTNKNNSPLAWPADNATLEDWWSAIEMARNDLQSPAEALAPEIAETLSLIAATNPLAARMSGSGATCFGLYETADHCAAAARQLEASRPRWYVVATSTVEEA
jgi:4-diphosphocytidyl-2-C-methyl-D-erythritol kinase